MKLIEIKNNLAKLQYEPADFPLVLSDFLTIDDGNQKILAQVVSIESAHDDETNCAVLKFSLDLNSDNTFCAYSGYVPTLDSLVSKTKTKILESIFSNHNSGVEFGQLTNSSTLKLAINPSIMDNFLYIQSDRHDDRAILFKKFMDLNDSLNKKTLYIDFDGLFTHPDANKVVLGKDFKLPIDNEVLNFIYENDLNGLTLEQKTIVQDIILEIQDYINSLEKGYIPFNTLLNVVNDIYQSDKSTGIILLRNKLLKYQQLNIFASKDSEILALQKSLENNNLTILSIKRADTNWQKEVLDFVTLNVDDVNCYVMFSLKEESFSKNILANLFRMQNLLPVIASIYDSEFAPVLKSYARNLIMFKPQTQQKAFATYNSFFNKLSDKEFIVSGEATYYTPLIIKEIPKEFKQIEPLHVPVKNIVEHVSPTQEDTSSINDNKYVNDTNSPVSTENIIRKSQEESDSMSDFDIISESAPYTTDEQQEFIFENDNIPTLLSNDDLNDEPQEITLEQEIAKDVDKMFYAEAAINDTEEDYDIDVDVEIIDENIEESDILLDENHEQNVEVIDYNKMFTDDDLDLLDNFETENIEMLPNNEDNLEVIDEVDNSDVSINEEPEEMDKDSNSGILELQADDELPGFDNYEETSIIENKHQDSELYDTSVIDNFPSVDESIDDELPDVMPNTTLLGEAEQEIPVYKTEIEEKIEKTGSIKFAEGNIVYHPKFGRGVVEQMVNYGNKSFCSILFDNVGRRLLDPNLAALKQM